MLTVSAIVCSHGRSGGRDLLDESGCGGPQREAGGGGADAGALGYCAVVGHLHVAAPFDVEADRRALPFPLLDEFRGEVLDVVGLDLYGPPGQLLAVLLALLLQGGEEVGELFAHGRHDVLLSPWSRSVRGLSHPPSHV
ncbi:hypothetical protein GCM10009566_42210 [Streptomyces murinus]